MIPFTPMLLMWMTGYRWFHKPLPYFLCTTFDHGNNWPELVLSVFWYSLKVQIWTAEHSNLNGEWYLQMINEEIDPHLHEPFEQQRRGAFRRSWWKQDGAPAHRRIIVGERSRELFNHRVTALNYDPEWLPRTLTKPRVIFFFGGISRAKFSRHHLETVKTPPKDINDLRGRIITWVDALRGQRAMICYVFQGIMARAEACVWRIGGHAEGRY